MTWVRTWLERWVNFNCYFNDWEGAVRLFLSLFPPQLVFLMLRSDWANSMLCGPLLWQACYLHSEIKRSNFLQLSGCGDSVCHCSSFYVYWTSVGHLPQTKGLCLTQASQVCPVSSFVCVPVVCERSWARGCVKWTRVCQCCDVCPVYMCVSVMMCVKCTRVSVLWCVSSVHVSVPVYTWRCARTALFHLQFCKNLASQNYEGFGNLCALKPEVKMQK